MLSKDDTFDTWFSASRFAFLSTILISICFADIIFGGQSFFYRDFGCFGLPNAIYHRDSFLRGDIPLWNPYSYCGLPFAAQWNSMVFYPGSLLYLILPLPWSLNIFCLAHLLIGSVGMYCLAFRLTQHPMGAALAGVGFVFSGLMLHSLMWPNNIAALGLAPLVILAWILGIQKGGKWIPIAGLLTAVQLLAGAPEVALFTWTIAAIMGTICSLGAHPSLKPRLLRVISIALLSVGVAALQLFPFLNLLGHSQRNASFDDGSWALPVYGLVNFLAPLFGCTPSVMGVYSQDQQQWTSSYYPGIGILLFAVVALIVARHRWVWALGFLVIAGTWMAIGKDGGLHSWVHHVFPWIGFVRFPVKFLLIPLLCLPICAAVGVKAVIQSSHVKVVSLVACSFALILIGVLVLAAFSPLAQTAQAITNSQSAASRLLLLSVITLCVIMHPHCRNGRVKQLVQATIVCLCFTDGISHAPRQNPTVHARVLKPEGNADPGGRSMLTPRIQTFLNNAATPIASEYCRGTRAALFANWNLLDRTAKVNGFFSLLTAEQAAIDKAIYSSKRVPPSGLLDFLGVSRISSEEKLFEWEDRPGAMPLITGGQAPVFADSTNALAAILSPEFDPRHKVILPLEAREQLSGVASCVVKISAIRQSPHEIRVWAETEDSALITIAQAFYPSWKAQVDGKAAPLFRANYNFQALQIPPGKHEVSLFYEDRALYAGILVTGLSVAVCFFLLISRKPDFEAADVSNLDTPKPIGRHQSPSEPHKRLNSRRSGVLPAMAYVLLKAIQRGSQKAISERT